MVVWESPEQAGQMALPIVGEQLPFDGEVLRSVRPGQAAVIVDAYDKAARMADALWDALERAGLGPEVVAVVPSLGEDLRPVVRVQLTPSGAARAGWLFDRSGAGPP